MQKSSSGYSKDLNAQEMREITTKAHQCMMQPRMDVFSELLISMYTCKRGSNSIPYFFCSIVKILCDYGADFTLADIEGNTPRDLADKNGQNKCARYLTQVMKQRGPKGTKRQLTVSACLLGL